MAGSYRHITDHNNKFKGLALLENLGDAKEAHEELVDMLHQLTGDAREQIASRWPIRNTLTGTYVNIKRMFDMVQDITGGDRERIWNAWKYGHLQRVCPSNLADESISGFKRYWSEYDETTLAGDPLHKGEQQTQDHHAQQTQLLYAIVLKLEEIRCAILDSDHTVRPR